MGANFWVVKKHNSQKRGWEMQALAAMADEEFLG
jgi:hypothetical protein